MITRPASTVSEYSILEVMLRALASAAWLASASVTLVTSGTAVKRPEVHHQEPTEASAVNSSTRISRRMPRRRRCVGSCDSLTLPKTGVPWLWGYPDAA